MKTKLSVNINKVALIRNARGGKRPDLLKFAQTCVAAGADGITVHPRPDERHIRYDDCPLLKSELDVELNIEGYPNERFLKMIEAVKPDQCTLVPDPPGALTSSEGWNTIDKQKFLLEVVDRIKQAGSRVSLFLDAKPEFVEGAAASGADRIELYTGDYALTYLDNRNTAIQNHIITAQEAVKQNLRVNAGHDLDLNNLKFYSAQVPNLAEVSIGHALVSDALYFGIQNTIGLYKRLLS